MSTQKLAPGAVAPRAVKTAALVTSIILRAVPRAAVRAVPRAAVRAERRVGAVAY